MDHTTAFGSFTEEQCIVGWTGRFEQNKGVNFLPGILQVACEAGCVLAVSGYSTNTKMKQSFEKQILRRLIKLSEDESCSFLLFQTQEQQREYSLLVRAATDIVVVPSYSEAFGLVAAEALAFGSIPVVSDAGGLPETVEPLQVFGDSISTRGTGIVFPIFDGNEHLTSFSVTVSLARTIALFQDLNSSGSLDSVQRRIIKSTPTRGVGVKLYDDLYQ